MRIVYKCAHCGVGRDFELSPDVPFTVDFVMEAIEGETSQVFLQHRIRKWIRHPCGPGMHGIAHLVAVLEE
jgi:hypothetical protein